MKQICLSLLGLLASILPQGFKEKCKGFLEARKTAQEYKVIKRMLRSYKNGFILLGEASEYDKNLGGLQYYSQVYQDMYLDNFIFKKREKGFFVDVGGNHPTFINNTLFFEKERRWNGLAFEPMPKLNEEWKKTRNAECLSYAVGASIGDVEFCEYDADYMSGISDAVDYNGKVKSVYSVKMTTLQSEFDKRGIKDIDFMSLDVEGYELQALQGVDFEKTNIYCIVVENNKSKSKEKILRKYLLNAGYRLQARLWFDDVWIKK